MYLVKLRKCEVIEGPMWRMKFLGRCHENENATTRAIKNGVFLESMSSKCIVDNDLNGIESMH